MRAIETAAAGFSILASSAGAMPPPVTVQPLLIVPVNDARTRGALTAAVQQLVERNYLDANPKRLRSVAVGRECIETLDCVAAQKQLKRHGGKVAVIAWASKGPSGDHELRCVGPDPLRHFAARINLRVAANGDYSAARPQLTKLARCIVDMVLPPKRAE